MDSGDTCLKNAGQIYLGDIIEAEDGSCTRHGQGRQIFTGATVAGEEITWANYKGGWQHGSQSGFGCYTWNSGCTYEGQFAAGKMHGSGKFTWPEGSWYEGHWFKGEMTGQGDFYSAYDGITLQGTFRRNCWRRHDGSWVDVHRKREEERAARLRINPAAHLEGLGRQDFLPVTRCTPEELEAVVTDVLQTNNFVPLVVADAACPDAAGSSGSRAPLWCLEAAGITGCTPQTTVYLSHAAAEKRRRRNYEDLFRSGIREALLTGRIFTLVFGDDDQRRQSNSDNLQSDRLPALWSLDEFFDPLSLPPDVFDLRHFNWSGEAEVFLPLEKQGWKSVPVPGTEPPPPAPDPTPASLEEKDPKKGGKAAAKPKAKAAASPEAVEEKPPPPPPPILELPTVYLLRFALVSLSRTAGSSLEDVRASVAERFAQHVPLHRVSIILVSTEDA